MNGSSDTSVLVVEITMLQIGIFSTKDLLTITFKRIIEQGCIPVGCVPPAHNLMAVGVSLTETPCTETLCTETPLDRDHPPVNRITDRCKNIILLQLHCGR